MVKEKLKELAPKPVKRRKTRRPVKDFLVRTKNKIKNSKDTKAAIQSIGNVFLYGILIGVGLGLFGIPITFLSCLSSGCLAYIFDLKILDMITRIISSFKLVVVNR